MERINQEKRIRVAEVVENHGRLLGGVAMEGAPVAPAIRRQGIRQEKRNPNVLYIYLQNGDKTHTCQT